MTIFIGCSNGYKMIGSGADQELSDTFTDPENNSFAGFDFGGMYGFVDGIASVNPATGNVSCPEGYTAQAVLGTSQLDWPVFYCLRRSSANKMGLYDFGGMFGYGGPNGTSTGSVQTTANNIFVNPWTGKASCPSGFKTAHVLGSVGIDWPLYYCYRPASSSPIYKFGGMYGFGFEGGKNIKYPNSATQKVSCPAGYFSVKTYGTLSVDYDITYCVQEVIQNISSRPEQENLFVATWGNDTNDGSFFHPLQSLEGARHLVRPRLKTVSTDITINLLSGVFSLTTPFMLDELDSGWGSNHIVYQALSGNDVQIVGGIHSNKFKWTHYRKGIWSTKVDIYSTHAALDRDTGRPIEKPIFRNLYVDGQPAVRARHPNLVSNNPLNSFSKILSWAGQIGIERFPEVPRYFQSHDLLEDFESAYGATGGSQRCDDTYPNPIEIVPQLSWTQSFLRVQSVKNDIFGTTPSLSVQLCQPEQQYMGKQFPPTLPNQPFHFENALEFIDSPHEWFYDANRQTLYYQSANGQSPEGLTFMIPTLENLISIKGKSPKQKVQNVTIRNLTFENSTSYDPIKYGYVGLQAGTYTGGYGSQPGAVEVQYAKGIILQRNTFKNLGGQGISFRESTEGDVITENTFSQISGSCLSIGESKDWSQISINDQVTNNTMRKCGIDYGGSVAIFAQMPQNLILKDNSITDMPYTGISVGWGWDWYNETTTIPKLLGNNLISGNSIKNVMNLLYDGAAIYTLASQPGTVIENNYISNMVASGLRLNRDTPPSAIYLDQGSEHIVVKNNLLRRIWSESGDVHKLLFSNTCYANSFSNNLISNNAEGEDVIWTSIPAPSKPSVCPYEGS